MAFEIQRIDPLDRQPRKAVGVALPFSGRSVFNSTFTTRDAIKTNLINYFLTARGERVFNLNFGAGLRNFLFTNINQNAVSTLRSSVEEDLRVYFPRVQVRDLRLVGNPDLNTVRFSLKYAVVDTNINNEEINIDIEV